MTKQIGFESKENLKKRRRQNLKRRPTLSQAARKDGAPSRIRVGRI